MIFVYAGATVVFLSVVVISYLTGKRSAADELAQTLIETSKKLDLEMNEKTAELQTNTVVSEETYVKSRGLPNGRLGLYM